MSTQRVGRQESMRWAAPEQNYDGGDWADEPLYEIEEENDEVASIKSEELEVEEQEPEHDYRDIYEYYNDDDDVKRQSYNEQLEQEIYQQLTPGHSRNASADSTVDPELAALYQGTSEFLNRPISIYADQPATRPLSLHGSESDRQIHKILTPKTGLATQHEESELETPTIHQTPKMSQYSAGEDLTTPTGSHIPNPPEPKDSAPVPPMPAIPSVSEHTNVKPITDVKELEEPREAAPKAPVTEDTDARTPPESPRYTPIHSPSLAQFAVTPSDLPNETLGGNNTPPHGEKTFNFDASPTPRSDSRSSFVVAPGSTASRGSDIGLSAKNSEPEIPEDVHEEHDEGHGAAIAAGALGAATVGAGAAALGAHTSESESGVSKQLGAEAETHEEKPAKSAGPPMLQLTVATPEGSDAEEDVREHPDWQPRWAPDTKEEEPVDTHSEPALDSEDGIDIGDGLPRTDLHESQLSFDMSDFSDTTSTSSKPKPANVSGFVDEEMHSSGSETEGAAESDTGTINESDVRSQALESKSVASREDGSTRSTIGTLENDREPIAPLPTIGDETEKQPQSMKSISSKVSRAPVVDLKAVFALNSSSQRNKALVDLRLRESEYTTQLSTWLANAYQAMDDKSLVYPNGQPPESEGHSLPVSRQVGTTISQSTVKTKETFQKVGKGLNVKGLNAMKKFIRHKEA